MEKEMSKYRAWAVAVGVSAMATLAGGASASTMIDLVGDRVSGVNVTPNYVFGTVTCSASCQGLLADGTLSDTMAFADDIGNASPENVVTNLNAFFDPLGTFLTTSATREDNGSSPFTFETAYVALKAGQITAYIFNTAGVSQTLSYAGNPAGGLSNKTFIGALGDTPVGPPSNPPTNPIPLPAGIVLLAGALGGLGLIRRKD
jgi:hypothetical protein